LPDLYKKIEDLVDKTALIKSLKEPEDKIGEPSPIRGNKFSHVRHKMALPADNEHRAQGPCYCGLQNS
jgi:hypothetical protein